MERNMTTYARNIILLNVLFMLSISCKKKDDKQVPVPVVTTAEVSAVTKNSAISGGYIAFKGGEDLLESGVCWSTNPDPTIDDSKATNANGTDVFSCNLAGLSSNTNYYVRAYATNSGGTGYGEAKSFTTLKDNYGTVTDIDGNIYHTVIIGSQVWTVENLKTTRYRNGDLIPNYISDSLWKYHPLGVTGGGYCNYQNTTNTDTINTYGHLYNWYAVNDSRNIAPTGWHVPTLDEWKTLVNFCGGTNAAGGKLKEAGTFHWMSPNSDATNETGFTALPGGLRTVDNTLIFISFTYFGLAGEWWSSSKPLSSNGPSAYSLRIYDDGNIDLSYPPTFCGLSVRCIKD